MSLQTTRDFYWLLILLNMRNVDMSNTVERNEGVTHQQSGTSPIVTIPHGTLKGITVVSRKNKSISAFLGIPYAQPPIGNLRFSSPVAANAWNGTLDASVEGNWCSQPEYLGDEDCLYLNVYTPQLPESDNSSLLPVMVFIPGGGFDVGTGDSKLYGPNHLLDADVVLVVMNYRLGPLGFFSTGDEVAPGNWSLKDQVLALQWVQKNIAYFGGDPDQVTIFGHSAGGASVQLLALSDSTIGLFHKFISQSGAAFGYWAHRPRSSYANVALKLGELFGCPTNASYLLVDCLRELNASDITNSRPQFTVWDIHPKILWGPTDEPNMEGAFLTDTPANLIAAGKIRDLPSITGIVRDEGIAFVPGLLPDSDTFKEFLENFDDLLPIVLQYSDRVEDVPSFTAAIKKFYFNNDLTSNRTQVWFNCVKLISDGLFIYPVYSSLQKQVASAQNAPFFYSFEYQGTYNYWDQYFGDYVVNTGVGHSDELLYLFPETEFLFGIPPEEMSNTDLRIIDTMVQLWTSFAINGTPTTTATISNITWVAYSSEDNNYLRIGNGSVATLDHRYNFLQERMQFWTDLTATGSGNTTTVSPFLGLIFVFVAAYAKILS